MSDVSAGNITRPRGDEVYRLFALYRGRVGRNKVRGFIPLLTEVTEQGHHPWVAVEQHPEETRQYSETRMAAGIRQVIQLHMPAMVAFGGVSWDEARKMAHGTVDEAVDEAEALAKN